MATKDENKTEKLKYPKSIIFIVSNEFCERFSFYGMRTVLTLYLHNKLEYSENDSTVIYHVFTMFVYFFPLFGAMLSDSLLGKFRTILYLSIIYTLGQLLLSLSAAPFGIPAREFSLLSLLIIAIGTGGIKPCVSAFGGDQFVLPQQERYLSTFFSLFYFSINGGSVISTFLTPILRRDVSCFDLDECYPLSFFVPAVLMATSVVFFIIGRPMYKIVKPSGNVVLNVTKCISHAICEKISRKGPKKENWLDYAEDKYDKSLINDIKASLQVLKLFIPLPIFWALFDQQGSRWTIQATRMNGEIGSFTLEPDQMQVFNPLLVLIFIPLFETCIYPLMAKIGLRTPLRKLIIGGLLAALSFVVSALIEMKIRDTNPVLPSEGFAQLRVFNTLNCPVNLTISDHDMSFALKSLDMYEDKMIPVDGRKLANYTVDYTECNNVGITNESPRNGSIDILEAKANSWIVTPKGIKNYIDSVDKSRSGDPLVRALIFIDNDAKIEFYNEKPKLVINVNSTVNDTGKLHEIKAGVYDILINGVKAKSEVPLKFGGVYTVVGSVINNTVAVKLLTITDPNSVHLLWLLPQYIIITMGEVMFSVTGLEFAFTQAPVSMKSLLQSAWLLTVAFGNLIVVIVAEVSLLEQVYEFFLFAGLMLVDILLFALIAKYYKYVETPEQQSIIEDIPLDGKNGTVNASYKHDDN